MKKEKVVALITAILMTAVISAGCAGNNSEDSQNSSDNTETLQSTYDYSQDDTTASDDDNSADSSVGNENTPESSGTKETDNSDGDNSSSSSTENENDTGNINNTQQSSDSETSQQSSQGNGTQQSPQTPLNQQQTNSGQTNSTSSGHSPSSPQSPDKPSSQSTGRTSSGNSNGTSGGSAPQTNEPSPTQPTDSHNNQPSPTVDPKTEAEEIYLSSNSVKLKMGETINLNTADRSYSYYIDNASVIEYSNGILKGKNPGSATISFKTVNGVTSSCKVEVYGVPSSVKLNKTSIKLDEGDSYTLSAKTNIGNYGISYEWSSTNPNVVSVESTDYSTAVITAKTPGTAVVTAETANGVSSVCRITVNPIKNEQSDDYEQYEDEVIRLVNKERTARGLPKLKKRNDLVPLANTRAKEIVSKFDHIRPDGRNSFTILSDNNIQYSSVGENIAYGQDTPEYAMKCWMDSKGHRENILSTKFNGIGVGCYEHNGTLYWVQLFIHE